MKKSTIYLGADHAGFELKEAIQNYLEESGYQVKDLGAETLNKDDDYPDFGRAVGVAVNADPGSYGIASCGNAEGICMAANKVKGVRAAIGYSEYAAKTTRTDDDANVLCLPGRVMDFEKAKPIVDVFLATPFSGAERHERRLKKVEAIEEEEMK